MRGLICDLDELQCLKPRDVVKVMRVMKIVI